MAKRHSPAEPVHTVKLDGREYRVRYDFNALAVFHEITGVNLLHGWPGAMFGPREVAAFLFCGLLHHNPDVDYKWCLGLLNMDNYEEILAVHLKPALSSAMPETTGEKQAEGNA